VLDLTAIGEGTYKQVLIWILFSSFIEVHCICKQPRKGWWHILFCQYKTNVGIMIKYLVLKLKSPLESLTVTVTTRFTVAVFVEWIKDDHGYVPLVVITIEAFFSRSWHWPEYEFMSTYHHIKTRETWWVPLV
jgi:hypothetical protein